MKFLWALTLAFAVCAAEPAPNAKPFDDIVTGLMRKYDVPGGSLVVARDGRILFTRCYGVTRRGSTEPVAVETQFRLASLSKQLTAAGILKLVEAGKLKLDDKAFALLPGLTPPSGTTPDPRIAGITIRQLLDHSAGWDRAKSFDPMFRGREAAAALNAPPVPQTVIRWMLGKPLQFTPGSDYAYSNLGYSVLGRIIERVTGIGYERFIRTTVLEPAGAGRMRLDPQIAIFDSHGGWLGSPTEVVRFWLAMEGRGTKPLLAAPSLAAMIARPANPHWAQTKFWYGLGVNVRPVEGDANWWHTGSLDTTATLAVRTHHGYNWVAMFNKGPGGTTFPAELDRGMWTALGKMLGN